MRGVYQVTAIVCLLFAAFVFRESLSLRYYTGSGPGPGFFPFWLSLSFGLLAILLFISVTMQPRTPLANDFLPERGGYRRLAVILSAIALSVILLKPMGFRLTTLGFYLVMLAPERQQQWITTIAVAIIGSFGVFFVFDSLLGTPLPIGFFGI